MTFTVHADSLFDPGAPVLGSTHLEARDNLEAALAGEDDAPRASTKMVEDLTVGDTERLKLFGGGFSFGFMQEGEIRAKAWVTAGSGASVTAVLTRTRDGVNTILYNGDLAAARSIDVTIEKGDGLSFALTPSSSVIRSTICTGGENLWPGQQGLLID